MEKELAANELEQVAGGIKINGYDYEQGDKFLAESGRFCYILKAYTQVQPNDIVEAVVENANGSAFKASVRVVCLLDWEYLGVDIGGMTRALAIARL